MGDRSLTEPQQRVLLRLARQALEESVREHSLSDVSEELATPLRDRCGVFVTILRGGRLRGCMGYVEAFRPLFLAVRECTSAAALQDPRFTPVTAKELFEVRVEISVLSPLQDIAPEQIKVGHHGLLISLGVQRGLLLPQIPVQRNWDRERFLEQTCLKAGLPPDAWREGARIQAFTAQVFEEVGAAPHFIR
jgi:AmmeMemoRadiSam system protein A